jgi:hypothetical protein
LYKIKGDGTPPTPTSPLFLRACIWDLPIDGDLTIR